MKHFWVFAFVSIIITAFFGGFAFPEKGYAQSIDSQTTTGNILNQSSGSLDDWYKQKGLAILQTQIDRLTAKQTDPDVAKKYGGLTSKSFQDYVLENQKIVTKLEDGKKVLTQTYDYLISKGNVSAAAYNASLTKVNNTEFLLQTTDGLSKVAEARADLSIVTTAIRLASVENTENLKYSSNPTDVANGQSLSAATNKAAKDSAMSCGTLAGSPFINCIEAGAVWIVKNILLEIVGFFLWMSANLLNFAMYHGVFKFSEFAPKEIYNIWLVVRQVISLFVFFAGLFVGFMAILGKSEEFKKYIVFLIVFGLFVNFSYPIVRVFVDVSNVVSLQIYQTTLGKDILLTDNPSSDSTAGARIMSAMGLQGLVASATDLPTTANNNNFINQVTSLPGAIAVVGFVGYAAYIFFMAAFLIIARTALLVCIIIASPILLVDTIVPALGEKAKMLRGMFVSQLFVAPVFTIMLALTLKFLDIFGAINKGPSALSSAGTTGTSAVTVFFNLIMMLVMLHIMLKVTKAVAGGVGDTVTNWAGKVGGMGVGLTAGAAMAGLGFAGRETLGKVGEHLGQQGGVLGDVGRKMAGAKYDLRNLKTVQSGAKMMGADVGKGVDKNRKELLAERNAGYVKTAEGIENDAERQKYFNRTVENKPFNYAGFAGTPNSKEYRRFVSNDEDTMKQYVNAKDKDRVRMRDDDKNKKFLQRFGYVDANDTTARAKMSPETLKAVKDKEVRLAADEARNESRMAGYMTADQMTRDNILANAIKAGDDKLIKQLEAMDTLRGDKKVNLKTINAEELKKVLTVLENPSLEQKVSDNILAKQKTTTASEGEASALAKTNEAINKMIKDNKSLTAAIKSLVNTKVPLDGDDNLEEKDNTTPSTAKSSPLDATTNPSYQTPIYNITNNTVISGQRTPPSSGAPSATTPTQKQPEASAV